MGEDRLGTMFHETFAFSRAEVSQVLKAIAQNPGLTPIGLRQNTDLGTNQVKAMPRYAIGAGLIDIEKKSYRLTALGNSVFEHDPMLESPATKWLMHYQLSAPLGPGPAYWHELVSSRFRGGDEFSVEDVANQIGQFYASKEGRALAPRSTRSSATVFLGTYTKPEGLGDLHVLSHVEGSRYRAGSPEPPSAWVVAFALVEYWHAAFETLATVNLNDLYGEKGLSGLFMMGRGRLNEVLEELQAEGVVELYRVAPPYQVALLWRDTEPILRRLYGGGPA